MAGKGKVSNDLVAVGCAAVLAVYAAGYWRTRDAARRIETQAQERRPVVPVRPAGIASSPPAMEFAATGGVPPVASPLPPQAPVAAEPAIAPVEAARVAAIAPQDSPPAAAAAPSKEAAGPAPPASPSVDAVRPTSSPSADSAIPDAALTATIEPALAVDPATIAPAAALPGWKDGTYSGWGTSRHGDILAQVVIRDGRIVESSIVSCETRWPCDVISGIIDQPVQRQSAEVDRVSRATASADAYYFALVQALERAIPEPSGETATPP